MHINLYNYACAENSKRNEEKKEECSGGWNQLRKEKFHHAQAQLSTAWLLYLLFFIIMYSRLFLLLFVITSITLY